ncbi:MAG: hypothetical protein JXQ73_23635 [Phycisphaerae bacterium]|nr:hypothetical protein [Phycisphaerae bacterium]
MVRVIAVAVLLSVPGCQKSGPMGGQGPPMDDFVPFEGADVVRPEDENAKQDSLEKTGEPPTTLPVDKYIVAQLKRYAAQVPPSLRMGEPEVLWFDGPPGQREGVVVTLLVRRDVYGQPSKLPVRGDAKGLLQSLMASVGGHVMNGHRLPENHQVPDFNQTLTLAQAAYFVLNSAGLSGRIQNANRWVLGQFKESDTPVDAFRPVFDEIWEACDALRASEPVLVVGDQVLGRDDLRLRRLYRRAHRELDWPAYAGSAPDPGLMFSPAPPQP